MGSGRNGIEKRQHHMNYGTETRGGPRRFSIAVVVGVLATLGSTLITRAQPAAPTPSAPATTAKAGRTSAEIQADLQIAGTALRDALGPAKNLRDPARRAEAAPKALPAMKKMESLYADMGGANPQFKAMADSAR